MPPIWLPMKCTNKWRTRSLPARLIVSIPFTFARFVAVGGALLQSALPCPGPSRLIVHLLHFF